MSEQLKGYDLIDWAEKAVEGQPLAMLYVDRVDMARDILEAYRLGKSERSGSHPPSPSTHGERSE